MDLQELANREEIRRLMATYNINGDRGRVDLVAATFAQDGVIEFGGSSTQGRKAITERLSGGGGSPGEQPSARVVRHHLTTSLVDIDGDTATGRTYFTVFTAIGADHHGVYVDRLARTDEGWRFAHREVRIDWQADGSQFEPLHVRGQAPA